MSILHVRFYTHHLPTSFTLHAKGHITILCVQSRIQQYIRTQTLIDFELITKPILVEINVSGALTQCFQFRTSYKR